MGSNPTNGVVVPFFVKAITDSTKACVVVMDGAGKQIKTFTIGDKDNELEIKEGLNFFNWDLNYPEGEKPAEGLIIWNRVRMVPVAPPGNYSVKIKVDQDSVTIPVTVIADPNYTVSQQDYEAQFQFLIKARDKFSETMKALQTINDLRKQMKDYTGRLGEDCPREVKELTKDLTKKLTDIETALHQTKSKSSQDVLNYPIQLDDKLSSVYRVASVGNGTPTKQTLDAYEVVTAQINEQLDKLKAIIQKEIPVLNNLIREKTLPIISAKE